MRSLTLAVLLVPILLSMTACSLWKSTVSGQALAEQIQELDQQATQERLESYVLGLHTMRVGIDAATPPDSDERGVADFELGRDASRQRLDQLITTSEDALERVRQGELAPLAIVEDLKNVRAQALAIGNVPLKALPVVQRLLSRPENTLWIQGDEETSGLSSLRSVLSQQALLPELKRRSQLFERKYFHSPEDENSGGNFLEGWLQSSFDVFRSDQLSGARWSEYAGVSPWEATARIEPVISFDDSGAPGILGAIGVTRHLFPASGAETGSSFFSDYIQRVGLRLGAGVVEEEGETADFVFGVALQVRSLTLWALVNGEEGDVALGIGSGDFRWVNELVTQFDSSN